MTEKKQETPKKEAPKKDKFQEEFKELSLEEKIKTLLKMEAVTLQETFSYGLNESMKAADRLGDVLTDFSKKVEAEFKKVTHKEQHPPPKSKSNSTKT
jgi:predicted metallopeptidase